MNGFKNLKIKAKLIMAFMITVILAIIVGLVGIYAMTNLSDEADAMYDENTVPLGYIARLQNRLGVQRTAIESLVSTAVLHPSIVGESFDEIEEYTKSFDEMFATYKASVPLDDALEQAALKDVETAYAAFTSAKNSFLDTVNAALVSGEFAKMMSESEQLYDLGQEVRAALTACNEHNINMAAEKSAETTGLARTMLITSIAVLAIAVVISIAMALAISGVISAPLNRILNVAQQAGSTGNLHFSPELVSAVKNDAQYKDETGRTSAAFASMMDTIIGQSEVLEKVAGGDLTVVVTKSSQQDTLGNAIEKMINNLNSMFGKVNMSTEQVNAGSTQIADGAQALSQGATEQASAVEELSAAMSEVLAETKRNTESANSALNSVNEASRLMGDTVQYMNQMQQAMGGIASSSEEIAKIIKVIDDIAFQTNILALNAAVEAARAGQHGKGFAVVADEVRNLASKSAEAAKETAALIQKSLEQVNLGTDIVGKTSQSIEAVAVSASQTQMLIAQINEASLHQESAIVQINTGIEQVSQVVQTNSATAEESAASSEELSAQAQVLKGLVANFKLSSNAGMMDSFDSGFGGGYGGGNGGYGGGYGGNGSKGNGYGGGYSSAPAASYGGDRYAFPEDDAMY